MDNYDEGFAEIVDKWEQERPVLFIAFLASLVIVMPFISAAISVYDGSRVVAFCLRHKRWPTALDPMDDNWTKI